MPRFRPENVEKNQVIFEHVNAMATKKGCTPSQLALAWVHHQGTDVCPIPGTTKIENFNQNIEALSIKLTPEEMAELESYALANLVEGDQYSSIWKTWRDSETPPLSSWKGEWVCFLIHANYSMSSCLINKNMHVLRRKQTVFNNKLKRDLRFLLLLLYVCNRINLFFFFFVMRNLSIDCCHILF